MARGVSLIIFSALEFQGKKLVQIYKRERMNLSLGGGRQLIELSPLACLYFIIYH